MEARRHFVACLIIFTALNCTLEPICARAGTISLGHDGREKFAQGNRAASWRVDAQSWPDCRVGPDNFKYYFLGSVPAGTASLQVDLQKKWDGDDGPLLCFRRGGPPLPSANTTWMSLPGAASAAGWAVNGSFQGACAPFTADAHLVLSEEDVLEGPWSMALFIDPSDTRFQSKMIQRGPVYPFSFNVTTAGCGFVGHCPGDAFPQPSLGLSQSNPHENEQTPSQPAASADPPSFLETVLHGGQTLVSSIESSLPWSTAEAGSNDQPTTAPVASEATECYSTNDSFPLYLPSPAALLLSVRLLQSPGGVPLPGFSALIRWGALPVLTSPASAYPPTQTRIASTGNATGQLEARVPNARAGWWYLQIVPENATVERQFCVDTWRWAADECAEGRMGRDCEWPLTRLNQVLTGPTAGYRPPSQPTSSDGWFDVRLLQPLVTTSPSPFLRPSANAAAPGGSASADDATGWWAYLSYHVPESAAGRTLTLEARGDFAQRIQLFTKLEGAPTENDFDYFASFNASMETPNRLRQSRGLRADSDILLSRSTGGGLELVVQYPAAGTWYVGLFLAPSKDNRVLAGGTPAGFREGAVEVEVRVRLGPCPRDCLGHGECATYLDEGLAQPWSTCECDRTHGGADCGVEVLSPGQEWRHVAALTLSNAAAIPAAGWAYSHQAYPEWLVFTLGGLASAVYHLCDAGGSCLAQYGTLQFSDFLLSFLAVVLTCLHLAPLPPSATAAVQLGATLFMAVLAKDDATSGWNLVAVACLGALALALGWGLEAGVSRKRRTDGPKQPWWGHVRHVMAVERARCPALPSSGPALLRWLLRRYCWPYLVGGLAMLGLAAAAWTFETGPTYWIWHSLWHVSIFMCPFFLLSATKLQSPNVAAAVQEYAAVLDDEANLTDREERELQVVVEGTPAQRTERLSLPGP